MKLQVLFILIFTVYLASCVEPYNPPAIKNAESLLVVDAQIDGEKGEGMVKLSRTVALDFSEDTVFDIHASVYVEDENGNQYFFEDQNGGLFTINGLNINYGDKLQLNITTQDEETYQSDFVLYKETPEIDSVSWKAEADGVQFYVTTHDPDENSTYYKWEFEETWEFNSAHQSGYYYDVEEAMPKIREDPTELYICYQFYNSNNILLSSSEKYSKDVISEFPLTFVSADAGKFERTYSILVRQKVLSKEEYEYWLLLKNNTEDLGGFFDPQPSQIQSNIYNVDHPEEKVLGYFSINSFKEKRIFVNSSQITRYDYKSRYSGCRFTIDTVALEELPVNGTLIITSITSMGIVPDYLINTTSCIDCTLIGTNEKPDYWIE